MLRLYEELERLPSYWQLVPVSGKRPLGGKNWNQRPYTSEQLRQWILVGGRKQRACTGFGLLTGTPIEESGNWVLALDLDGETAQKVLNGLSQGQLSDTVAFTSARPGRCQRLYKVPNDIAPTLRSRKLKGGVELRWTGSMSVLPPSIHPITHQPYCWLSGCSPSEREIAFAPQWLIQLMSKTPTQTQPRATVRSEFMYTLTTVAHSTIERLLTRLHPHRADDYHDWIRVGMALYSHSPSLLSLWDAWSRQSPKYKPGECDRKWRTFNPTHISIGTLYYLAKVDSAALTAVS